MTVLNDKVVKARKDHICNLCGGIIKKGDEYDCQTNVYDGQIYNFKSHSHCSELVSEYNMYEDFWEDGLTENDFAEFMNELVSESGTTAEKALILYQDLIREE